MDTQDRKEHLASEVAKLYAREEILGIGGGTTVECFIRALALEQKNYKSPLVIASTKISKLAKELGFQVVSWRSCQNFDIYIDGTDFISTHGHMSKGKGGAALGEKLISLQAKTFVCLFDDSKLCQNISDKPIYIEVMPRASSLVARELLKHSMRAKFIDKYSENDNWVMELTVDKWESFEKTQQTLDKIPGLISHGLFTKTADLGYCIDQQGNIEKITYSDRDN